MSAKPVAVKMPPVAVEVGRRPSSWSNRNNVRRCPEYEPVQDAAFMSVQTIMPAHG